MSSIKRIQIIVVVALVALSFACCANSKLLRRSRYYDDIDGPYGGYHHGGVAVPTGERAILTVRGARNPYDGSVPSKIRIEDNPYRGMYPRGVYDRLDSGYNGGSRYPLRPYQDYGSARRRRDFLDPDFNAKASLRLAGSKRRSNCRIGAEADSEILGLGLDSGRLNIDCEVNPLRVANVAVNAAKRYSKYKRDHRRPQSSRLVKSKRTKIEINHNYERAKHKGVDDDEDSASSRSNSRVPHNRYESIDNIRDDDDQDDEN